MRPIGPCSAAIVALSLLTGVPRARGQDLVDLVEHAPCTRFEQMTVEQAAAVAAKRHRLLFVCEEGLALDCKMASTTWQNPTLAAYIRWHGVAVRRFGAHAKGPEVNIYYEGGWLAKIKSSTVPDGYPKVLQILLAADVEMDGLRTRDPVWFMLHERANPAPGPPPLRLDFHTIDDEAGEAYPPKGDDGCVAAPPAPADPMARLDEARLAVELGDLRRATGLYTWLWEEAERADPAMGPLVRTILPGEMAALAGRRPASNERFGKLRETRAARLLWAGYADLADWATLNDVTARPSLTLEWFTQATVDAQEAAMMPAADRIAYDLLLRRTSFAEPYDLGETPEGAAGPDPVERVARIARALRAGAPRSASGADGQRFILFLRRLLRDESCRLHAACLKAGRGADAEAIAGLLFASDTEPGARRALVAAAVVAGEARPFHLVVLAEAARLGAPDADLERRVRAAATPGKDP